MSHTPDRVAADLRAFEHSQDGADESNAKLDEITKDMAIALIEDGEKLSTLVSDYEADIFGHLARALRNLDAACSGNKTATEAILNALSHLQRTVFNVAMKEVADLALRQAQD